MSPELSFLCPWLLLIWTWANSNHLNFQHVLTPSSMCSDPFIAGMSQLWDTSAAVITVIPCPVLLTSSPVLLTSSPDIQGSFRQILPSMEEKKAKSGSYGYRVHCERNLQPKGPQVSWQCLDNQKDHLGRTRELRGQKACGGLINYPQRHPCPDFWNLWLSYMAKRTLQVW